MKKAACVLSLVLALALVGSALAEEFTTETIPMTILGQPACMVRTVRQGGPLKGFLGNTAQAQTTYGLDKDGKLICLSTTQSNSDGVGKTMLTGAAPAMAGGPFYVWGQSVRRPDQTKVNVPVTNQANNLNNNTNGGVATAFGGGAISNSISGAVSNSVSNASAAAAASAAATASGGTINGNQGGGNND